MVGLIQSLHSDYPGGWHRQLLVGQWDRSMRKKVPSWKSFGLLQSKVLSKDFLMGGKTVFLNSPVAFMQLLGTDRGSLLPHLKLNSCWKASVKLYRCKCMHLARGSIWLQILHWCCWCKIKQEKKNPWPEQINTDDFKRSFLLGEISFLKWTPQRRYFWQKVARKSFSYFSFSGANISFQVFQRSRKSSR